MVIKWRKITKIEDKVKEIEEKPEKIRINKIKAAENLKADMELNKEKFNNIDWIEYKKYIIPIMLKIEFIDELKHINYWHNFLLKIYKKETYIKNMD